MSYIVSLKEFSGPLDLLLTLIGNAKIEIKDIFISSITEQYLESMALVDALDMDSASEFLQMASTLLEIKSRAMLPKPPKTEEGEESPEEALIRQLEEYKRVKEAALKLQKLEEEARALMTKLPEEYPVPPPNIEIVGLTLDKLMAAFRKVLERAKAEEATEKHAGREIRRDRFTVGQCMARIARKLKGGSFVFTALFDDNMDRSEIITMFLALLEMAKLGRVAFSQESPFSDILLRAAAPAASAETPQL